MNHCTIQPLDEITFERYGNRTVKENVGRSVYIGSYDECLEGYSSFPSIPVKAKSHNIFAIDSVDCIDLLIDCICNRF